jgi:hypothetical protein
MSLRARAVFGVSGDVARDCRLWGVVALEGLGVVEYRSSFGRDSSGNVSAGRC